MGEVRNRENGHISNKGRIRKKSGHGIRSRPADGDSLFGFFLSGGRLSGRLCSAGEQIIGTSAAVRVASFLHVIYKDPGTGRCIAACMMVVKRDTVMTAEFVQLMSLIRQVALTDLTGTDVGDFFLPGDSVVTEAFAQNSHIKSGIMGCQKAAFHGIPDFFPDFRKGLFVSDHTGADPCQLDIEVVKALLRIDQRVIFRDDLPLFDHGNADGTHAVVIVIGRFHVKAYKSCCFHTYSFTGMHYYKGHESGNQEGPAPKTKDP